MRPLGILGGAMSGSPPPAGGVGLSPVIGFTNVQTFTAAGTNSWTVPAGVTACFVEIWGGGAGGNGVGGSSSPCYGGGYSARHVTGLVPGSSISVTVGAGGAGASGNGATGGTSSFGAYASATGGAYNAAGNGSGGEINIASVFPDGGGSVDNLAGPGASGGLFRIAGRGGKTGATNGGDGCQPGGSGGNGQNGTGGNGAAGMVIIYW